MTGPDLNIRIETYYVRVRGVVQGVGFRHATRRLSRDVTGTGAALLGLPKRSFRMAANYRRISRFGVFRRWIRDHASLRG